MAKEVIKKHSRIQKLYARMQRYQMFFYAFIPGITAFVLIAYKNGLAPIWSYHITLGLTAVVLLVSWGSLIWTLKIRWENLKTDEEKQKYALIGGGVIILVIVLVIIGRWFVVDYLGMSGQYADFFQRVLYP